MDHTVYPLCGSARSRFVGASQRDTSPDVSRSNAGVEKARNRKPPTPPEGVHPPEARLVKGHAKVWVPLASCGRGHGWGDQRANQSNLRIALSGACRWARQTENGCARQVAVANGLVSMQRWTLFARQKAIGNHGKGKHGEYASVLLIAVW